ATAPNNPGNAQNRTAYATSARNNTIRKPKVIARMVDNTAPTTDAKPFTAHPHATYSRGNRVRPATAPRPSGMKKPKHTPSGASTMNANARRPARGQPRSASVMGGNPNWEKTVSSAM